MKDLEHHTESRRRGSDIRFFASLRMTEYVAQNDSERLRMTEYVAQNDSVQVREVFIISDVKREPVLQTSAVMDKSRNAPSMERHCVPDYGKPEP